MKIGSHVSNSGDEMLLGAAKETVSYDANCMMVYLGAPQNTIRKPFERMQADAFANYLKEHQLHIDDVIVHAPYILNLAQSDDEKREFAVSFLAQEIEMMNRIGLKTIVIHPGAFITLSAEEGIARIIESLQDLIKRTAHTNITLALETMAGKGSECCFIFDHLQQIITSMQEKRIKICLDTCHTFDSGYDWVNDYELLIKELDGKIGLENIAVIHLNDSKNPCGSKKDRHENIGFGHIGFSTLMKFCYDERFAHIPKILETPYIENNEGKKTYPPYKYEIAMLKAKQFDPNMKVKMVVENQ